MYSRVMLLSCCFQLSVRQMAIYASIILPVWIYLHAPGVYVFLVIPADTVRTVSIYPGYHTY